MSELEQPEQSEAKRAPISNEDKGRDKNGKRKTDMRLGVGEHIDVEEVIPNPPHTPHTPTGIKIREKAGRDVIEAVDSKQSIVSGV